MFLGSPEPLPYQFDLFRGRLDSSFGLLLKRMKDVHRTCETNCVDAAVSVSGVVPDELQNTGTCESLQRPCVDVPSPCWAKWRANPMARLTSSGKSLRSSSEDPIQKSGFLPFASLILWHFYHICSSGSSLNFDPTRKGYRWPVESLRLGGVPRRDGAGYGLGYGQDG